MEGNRWKWLKHKYLWVRGHVSGPQVRSDQDPGIPGEPGIHWVQDQKPTTARFLLGLLLRALTHPSRPQALRFLPCSSREGCPASVMTPSSSMVWELPFFINLVSSCTQIPRCHYLSQVIRQGLPARHHHLQNCLW